MCKTGVTKDRQTNAADSQVYLVWGQAQGPQGSIMGVYSLQKAS